MSNLKKSERAMSNNQSYGHQEHEKHAQPSNTVDHGSTQNTNQEQFALIGVQANDSNFGVLNGNGNSFQIL
jgi:hypothetical protein